MNLTFKKQLKIQKLILVFLILFNPLLINSIANTKDSDKSEINKKKCQRLLNTDSNQ